MFLGVSFLEDMLFCCQTERGSLFEAASGKNGMFNVYGLKTN